MTGDEKRSGRVVWITGLSGAGKTTLGSALRDRLHSVNGHPPLLLDGDALRAIFALETDGLGEASRRALALRYARLCAELAGQGLDVICATISMFHEVRRWNRDHIPDYYEVYLRVPIAELERRDPKGIYARFRAGEISNVVGLDLDAEEPESPDLVLENHGANTVGQSVERVLAALSERSRKMPRRSDP